MKNVCAVAVALVILTGAGCLKVPPMTESEFKGFCYQSGDNIFQDCDTIPLCDEYIPALNKKTRQECITECQAINLEQQRRYLPGVCGAAMMDAVDWCTRYCRTNHPN